MLLKKGDFEAQVALQPIFSSLMLGALGVFSPSALKSICIFSVDSHCKNDLHNTVKSRVVTEDPVALFMN